MPQSRFAVIGGGISGLTAAYRLTQEVPQARVQLFEASDRLGGVLSTFQQQDLLIERGADSFLTKQPWAVELCRELGLAEELIPTNSEHRRALVLCDGELHPVPEGFHMMRPQRALPILRSRLLSWQGKLRLLAERWIARPSGIDREDFDDNLAHFATERLGHGAYARLVEPLLAGIFTADATKLSVAATMPEAIALVREHGTLWHREVSPGSEPDRSTSGARYGSFLTLRDGMSRLVNELAGRLPTSSIQLNKLARQLSRDEDGNWSLQLADGSMCGPFTGVVTALPAPQTAKLVEQVDSQLCDLLRRIPYASSAVVSLAYNREQVSRPLDAFGLVVPAVEKSRIVAASFSSVKFPGRAPGDQVVVRVFLGGALHPELVDLPESELQSIAIEELSPLLRISGAPLLVEVVKWREKMPQYHVGHVQLVDEIEARAAQLTGFALAGNAYRGVGIPYCIRSGNEAAHRLATMLKEV
ncbi:protoporphyrinogen oxidase [Bythopirellula goksoeyrii]|uniref:protoporphyrinogen oxidase n=1 Tax=Bythopirellula goksoeyrii TaxID=1400387 RepID=UPI00143DFCDC|nr:protoporphyrinogen oxidase [Bythopirellula goksoeyrii]